jgi:uncharacterized protein (DUF4415 family)
MRAKPAKRPPGVTSGFSAPERNRPAHVTGEVVEDGDIPEPTTEDFARAIVRKGLKPTPRKQQVTLRVDADVLAWFKGRGKGYQSHINALLRAYMEAHRGR